MTRKLKISETEIRDAVIRNKSNSVAATYHLLSRRNSKGLGFPELSREVPSLSTKAQELSDKTSIDPCVKNSSDVLTEEAIDPSLVEVDISSLRGTNGNISPKPSEISSGVQDSIYEQALVSELDFDPEPDLSEIDAMAVNMPYINGRPIRRPDTLRLGDVIKATDAKTREVVARKFSGSVRVTKPHSSTTIMLRHRPASIGRTLSSAASSVNTTGLPKSAQKIMQNIAYAKETTPRESYKECLQKLRSQKTKSASKGILKTNGSESKALKSEPTAGDSRASMDDFETVIDDATSSTETLPLDGGGGSVAESKRQTCPSAKSVRFDLTEEEEVASRSRNARQSSRKGYQGNSSSERLVLRKLSAEKAARDAAKLSLQNGTWSPTQSAQSGIESLKNLGSEERIRAIQILRGAAEDRHRPPPAPPNSAQGKRVRNIQGASVPAHTPVIIRREPNTNIPRNSKTHDRIYDRYKLKIQRSGGGSDKALLLNVKVMDFTVTGRAGRAGNGSRTPADTRRLGELRHSIPTTGDLPLKHGSILPEATETNPALLTYPGSYYY